MESPTSFRAWTVELFFPTLQVKQILKSKYQYLVHGTFTCYQQYNIMGNWIICAKTLNWDGAGIQKEEWEDVVILIGMVTIDSCFEYLTIGSGTIRRCV